MEGRLGGGAKLAVLLQSTARNLHVAACMQ
jgi:hypothetical protein